MIWLFFTVLVWAAIIYLIMPLIKPLEAEHTDVSRADITAYRDEIANIETALAKRSDPELGAKKVEYEKRLLSVATTRDAQTAKASRPILGIIAATLIMGTLSTYFFIGRPELALSPAQSAQVIKNAQAVPARDTAASPVAENGNTEEASALVDELGIMLEGEKADDMDAWALYVRSLMYLERYDEAFAVYERLLVKTGNNPAIQAEYDSARNYAAQARGQSQGQSQDQAQSQTQDQIRGEDVSSPSITPQSVAPQRGPNQADIDAAASMSAEEQDAMINGMVDGLAARLAQTPDDPPGWVQLLHARNVLGQTEQRRTDIETVRRVYESSPDTAAAIFKQAGIDPADPADPVQPDAPTGDKP